MSLKPSARAIWAWSMAFTCVPYSNWPTGRGAAIANSAAWAVGRVAFAASMAAARRGSTRIMGQVRAECGECARGVAETERPVELAISAAHLSRTAHGGRGAHHPGRAPDQTLRQARSGARPRPGRARRRGLRLPGPERRGQDDDDPHADRPGPTHQRLSARGRLRCRARTA